jgi:hypothetical protein
MLSKGMLSKVYLQLCGDARPLRSSCLLTVLQPEFLKRFPNARFTFASAPGAQRGTFKGVWLNAERTEWALEKEEE